jgi:predicted metalloprotease
MRWSGGRRGGNIEDRRGMRGGVVGGVGAGGVILALIGYFVFGIDPSTTMQTVGAVTGGGQEQQAGVQGSPADEAGAFVDVVSTSVDDVWAGIFSQEGERYPPPKVVLYNQATGTGCGTGQAAMGPFYCPGDRKVYLDLTFWDELAQKFGAQGEAARAYVIAHEIGHHVQNLLGVMDDVNRAQQENPADANELSVRLELQADCLAGIWGHAAYQQGDLLESGDLEEGLNAAAAVGDDRIQSRSGGGVNPDSFTHGTSEQRVRWFRKGFDSGDPTACDTFKGDV